MTDFRDLEASLKWLAKRGFLSGSLGRGEAYGKDIDICVTDRTIADLKRGLNEQGVEWVSPLIGCIAGTVGRRLMYARPDLARA